MFMISSLFSVVKQKRNIDGKDHPDDEDYLFDEETREQLLGFALESQRQTPIPSTVYYYQDPEFDENFEQDWTADQWKPWKRPEQLTKAYRVPRKENIYQQNFNMLKQDIMHLDNIIQRLVKSGSVLLPEEMRVRGEAIRVPWSTLEPKTFKFPSFDVSSSSFFSFSSCKFPFAHKLNSHI